MSAQRVLLWRHGRTAFNHESRFQGQLDVALDEVGIEQAQRGARLLAGQITEFGPGPVRLLTSDLARASMTAAALGELLNIAPEPDQRLREINAGSWQGLTSAQITQQWPEEYEAWRRGDDVRLGGGETRGEAAARGASCISDVAASMNGGTLVCASHGATLRGAIFLLLGWPAGAWNRVEALRNAHWAQLQQMSYGWRLAAYNLGGSMDEYEPSPETALESGVTTARSTAQA